MVGNTVVNSNSSKVYALGSGGSFDIKSLLPDVNCEKLTADNFIICAYDFSYRTSAWGHGTTANKDTSITYTKTYSDGVLTITRSGDSTAQITSSGSDIGRTILSLPNPAVYLVIGEIYSV